MPIDPNIVSGLAPAAANLAQMGTFAQQQTAMEARRKREDEQRKQQQIQSILQTSPDDETAVQRLNALDIELGSKYRTQLDDHRKKVGDALKLDLDNDQAQTKLLTAVAQGITDSSTLETGRKLFSTFGDEGAKLASMLPAQWDDAQSPAQMKQFVEMGLSAADFTKKQQEALDRALKGDWDHGLAEMLATADTPEEAQGALEGFKAMRAPKLTLDRFAPLVANWGPEAQKKAGEMALSEQQRQTLAGQAATREQTATTATAASARAAAAQAETARHNRATEGQSAASLAESTRHNRTAEGQAAAGGTGGAKLSVAQQTDLADMQTLRDMAGDVETLGDEIKWSGVGGMMSGTANQFMARNFGSGTQKEQDLRNGISNITATIAKLRGGTAFTPNEQKLLEQYTPTIDDNSMVIKSKLTALKRYIELKKKNLLEVTGGHVTETPKAANAKDPLGIR